MSRLEETLRAAGAGRSQPDGARTVAVAMANNPEVIGSIGRAIRDGVAHFVLVGPPDEIRATAGEASVDITSADLVDETDPVAACTRVAAMAGSGEAHVIMKGLVQTADFVRAVLDRSHGLLPKDALISHVAVCDVASYHKLLLITDAAITVNPTVDEKVELIRNAAAVAAGIGITAPKVACVAPVEKVSDKVPSTVDAALLTERFTGDTPPVPGVRVAGPFGLDVAISRTAASIKGISSPVAGDADVLLMPGLDAGNALYKAITVLAGGMMAGVVAGTRVPIVLTSRADSEETKYLSLLLALAMAG
jgi:phosphate butyryltransferase